MDTSVIKASHIKRMRWVFFPSENLWWPCLLYSSAPALLQDIPNSSNMQLKIKIFLCAKELANPTQPVALLLGARPPKRVVEVRDEHLKEFMDEYFSLSDQRCPDDNWKTQMDQAVAFSVEWAKKASEMNGMDDESYDDSVVSFQDTVANIIENIKVKEDELEELEDTEQSEMSLSSPPSVFDVMPSTNSISTNNILVYPSDIKRLTSFEYFVLQQSQPCRTTEEIHAKGGGRQTPGLECVHCRNESMNPSSTTFSGKRGTKIFCVYPTQRSIHSKLLAAISDHLLNDCVHIPNSLLFSLKSLQSKMMSEYSKIRQQEKADFFTDLWNRLNAYFENGADSDDANNLATTTVTAATTVPTVTPSSSKGDWKISTQGRLSMTTQFEPELLDEVKNRLKLEYTDEFCKVIENGTNILPRPTFVRDLACHICHHRKPEGIRLSCLNHSHVYYKFMAFSDQM